MLGQAGVDCEEQGRRTVSTLVFEINSTEAEYPAPTTSSEQGSWFLANQKQKQTELRIA